MTDAQLALGVMVGSALKTLKTCVPALHLTTFSDAELDALEGDMEAAIQPQHNLLGYIRDEKQSRVIHRQEFEERGPI